MTSFIHAEEECILCASFRIANLFISLEEAEEYRFTLNILKVSLYIIIVNTRNILTESDFLQKTNLLPYFLDMVVFLLEQSFLFLTHEEKM